MKFAGMEKFIFKGCFLVLLIMGMLSSVSAQSNDWANLAFVQKTIIFDENFGIEMEQVEPGILAQQMHGKEIEVPGYIIPLTGKVKQSHFMFSKFPQNMCFFCGKAGPESAMQVFMKDDKKLSFTQEKITLKGTLVINNDEASGLLYTLQNGIVVE